MYVGDGKTCGHGGPGAGPQIHDFRAMWKQEMQLIARRYVTSDTTTTEEEDIMSTESTALLGTIADRLLVVSDALTTGKEGVKFDGDVIARLRSIESKLDAQATTEPERAESEPETPAEPAPVTGANAIRSACAAIRSEQAAHTAYIESRLSIIESNL